MKILYVVSRPLEINTSASIRNRATIKGLLDLGHSVDLLTTQYDKNHSNFDDSLIDKRLNVKYLKLNGIQEIAKYGRKYKFLKPLKKIAYKTISYFEIYDNLKGICNYTNKVDIKDNNYDLIISSSDPKSSHLFVYNLYENKILINTPWIQIWGDPFLSDITRNSKLLNRKIKKEESKLMKFATKIIYVSNLTLEEQKNIYSNYAHKMFYEPIPYVDGKIYPVNKLEKNEPLTFLYTGDYSSNIRNIIPLYKAIRNTNHKLIICGDSDLKLECTENINIHSRVSFEKTKELEKECDVLVHLSNLRGTQIPGKIFQYSGTNKIILFILDGNIEMLMKTFSKYNRYVFTDNKTDDIKKAIDKINQKEYEDTRFVVEKFGAKNIARNIIKI